jgi:hypothetical protein
MDGHRRRPDGRAQTLLARCRLLDLDLSSQAGLEHRFRPTPA